MPRFTLVSEPVALQPQSLSDKELLVLAEHTFPNPGPLVHELIRRLDAKAYPPHQCLEEGDGRHEREGACPACGTKLEIVASI